MTKYSSLSIYLATIALSILPSVSAHGYVSQVIIDGQAYAGNVPNNYKGPSPVRLVDDIGPVKGSSNPDLNCGLSAQLAAMVVPANPGSNVTFQWSGGQGGLWPHEVGPLMTYMAACEGTTCDKYNSSSAKWFKIDQIGQIPGGDGTTWYQQDIMQGDSVTVSIPQDISPGDYLIRHEIIALHLATSVGGAEFYPSCTQVRVGGSGTGQPQSTVLFPGAYSDTDPGIYAPDIYNPGFNYTFPGGPVSNLASTVGVITPALGAAPPFPSSASVSGAPPSAPSSSAASASSAAPPKTSTSAVSGSSSAASSSSTSKCKLKRSDDSNSNRKRHFKKMVRRISHSSH